jgi:transposase-like protein
LVARNKRQANLSNRNQPGITNGLLDKWKRQLLQKGGFAFPEQRHLTPEPGKIRHLKRDITVTEQERHSEKAVVIKATTITSAKLSSGFSNLKS